MQRDSMLDFVGSDLGEKFLKRDGVEHVQMKKGPKLVPIVKKLDAGKEKMIQVVHGVASVAHGVVN